MNKLKIIDIIGSPNAILHNFGLQVYEAISPFLAKNQSIELSFEGIKNVASAFCNASIGKAYLDFPNSSRLLFISGYDVNPIWKEKVIDAINLASNTNKINIQNQAISDLLCS